MNSLVTQFLTLLDTQNSIFAANKVDINGTFLNYANRINVSAFHCNEKNYFAFSLEIAAKKNCNDNMH